MVMQSDDNLFKPSERMRDLQVLEEIERNPKVSQTNLNTVRR